MFNYIKDTQVYIIKHIAGLLLTCLFVVNAPESLARDPYEPISFPPCQDEEGYPSSVVIKNQKTGELSNHLVVLARPFLDPANVRCWYIYETDEYAYTIHIHKHKKVKL